MELNREKTNITHVESGFNFLGFFIRQIKGSCLIFPEKQKVLALLQKIRNWLKKHKHVSPEVVIEFLNPILRGIGNFYRYTSRSRVFSYIDEKIWRALWNWCIRRHPDKGKKWVYKKYFQPVYRRKRSRSFTTTVQNRRGDKEEKTIFRLSSIPITRHVKIKGKNSPDDPNLVNYWQSRQSQYGKTYWPKGTKLYQIAENQGWFCPVCEDHLFNGEELHTHHKVAVKDGGSDEVNNRVHLHKACHRQLHSFRSGKQEA